MIEHDFPEDFVPIAAELQRLPYLAPSRDFADRVIANIDRLQAAQGVAPMVASRHLALHQGGRQAVEPRRAMSVARGAVRATAGVALIATAAFMFFEVDVLAAILATASSQYAFVMAAVTTQVGAMILGPETIAYLQAGALQSVILYFTLVVGLVGGYAGIRTAAHIAKRKAA